LKCDAVVALEGKELVPLRKVELSPPRRSESFTGFSPSNCPRFIADPVIDLDGMVAEREA
jgi:hypothetical protein